MADRVTTSEGIVVGGWVLRVDKDAFDVAPMVEAYGQIFRHPLPVSDRVELLAPGQPCFWFQADRSKVVGIWGVGEVVGDPFTAPVDIDDPSAGSHTLAEVEIYPLAKPIPLSHLESHPDFADSELLCDPLRANPIALRPGEVRVIEGLEFTIVPPSEEQLAALDDVLDAEDL